MIRTMRRERAATAMGALVLAVVLPAWGADIAAAPTTQPAMQDNMTTSCPVCEYKRRFNELIPGLTWSADLRLRAIYDNNLKLDKEAHVHERFWQRYRARVAASYTPMENLQFNIRLTFEPRYLSKTADDSPNYIRDEAIFDLFNIVWNKPLELPMKLTVGRQDIKLGDGWLVGDGTPRDGTRTFFFDAVRGTWDAKDIQSTLDVIALRDRANSSYFIHPFNDQNLDLVEQDETGVILWGANKSLQDTEIDGYFIYKHNDKVLSNGTDADIYTFGARAAGRITEHWLYKGEVAPQFGQKDGTTIHALGGVGELDYKFNNEHDDTLYTIYEYRSGSSNPNGAFDILWGRYTLWCNNIFNDYLTALEPGVMPSGPTNFHRVTFGWNTKPTGKLGFDTNYSLLLADHNTYAGTKGFSDNGVIRGHYFTNALTYKFNEHVAGHLRAEVFLPGDYYDNSRNDVAVYVQYELMISW